MSLKNHETETFFCFFNPSILFCFLISSPFASWKITRSLMPQILIWWIDCLFEKNEVKIVLLLSLNMRILPSQWIHLNPSELSKRSIQDQTQFAHLSSPEKKNGHLGWNRIIKEGKKEEILLEKEKKMVQLNFKLKLSLFELDLFKLNTKPESA